MANSPSRHDTVITRKERLVLGTLAGIGAAVTHLLSNKYGNFEIIIQSPELFSFVVIRFVLASVGLGFIGALISYVNESESNKMRLIATAISAPAMFTTVYSGTSEQAAPKTGIISIAFAGEVKALPEAESPNAFTESFKGLFGQETRYWVIVGSFKDRDRAQSFVDEINSVKSFEYKAYVGYEGNQGYFPVIVGGYVPYADALVIKQRALQLPFVKEAYLSAKKL